MQCSTYGLIITWVGVHDVHQQPAVAAPNVSHHTVAAEVLQVWNTESKWAVRHGLIISTHVGPIAAAHCTASPLAQERAGRLSTDKKAGRMALGLLASNEGDTSSSRDSALRAS